VLVLAGAQDGKVALLVAVTGDLTGTVKAGELIKPLAAMVGGRGGGRPELAQAGGQNPEQIDAMLQAAPGQLATLLGS
jgi:alanyl-tRNA synthetase